MLVDCMTKNMPPDAMMGYMKTMEYAFKYDDVIKETKREIAKMRRAKRLGTSTSNLSPDLEKLSLDDQDLIEEVNIVDHYPIYFAMFSFLHKAKNKDLDFLEPTPPSLADYRQDIISQGFRKAYINLVNKTTGDQGEISDRSTSDSSS